LIPSLFANNNSKKELRDKADLDEERRYDISRGIEAASAILERAKSTMAQEERTKAVQELKDLVEDWKNYQIERFGELLLYGWFFVSQRVNNGEIVKRKVSHVWPSY